MVVVVVAAAVIVVIVVVALETMKKGLDQNQQLLPGHP
jgi:hypothetical protein